MRVGKEIRKIEKYLGKRKPTKKELEKFNTFVIECLSEENVKKIELIKRNFDKKYKEMSKVGREKFIKNFLIKFTYNTNRIEGSTLTLRDTKLILADEIMPKGKTSREVKEAENHAEAFNLILNEKADLDIDFLLRLHAILLKRIDTEAGKIRKEEVAIYGSTYMPPPHEELDYGLKAFFEWYNQTKKIIHPFELACLVHLRFVTIHPFTDGNGRISRLLMNFVLKRKGYPMLDISYDDREEYYDALEKCQTDKIEKPFVLYCLKEYLKQYL